MICHYLAVTVCLLMAFLSHKDVKQQSLATWGWDLRGVILYTYRSEEVADLKAMDI